MASVYTINKGINKSIEFKGLKAQYIGYLAAGLIALLVLFVGLYVAGVNTYLCLVLILVFGTAHFMAVYHLNDTYGRYGLIKKLAARNIPTTIRTKSRRTFIQLTPIL